MTAYGQVARGQVWWNLAGRSLRVIVGGIFCFSGIMKIANHESFLKALVAYGLLPRHLVDVVGLVLPHAEIALGILFIFGVKLRLVGLTLVAMLIIFTVAGTIAHLRGGAVDCGCFPAAGAERAFGEAFLIRNGLLILACLLASFKSVGTRDRSHQVVELQES